MEESYQKGKKYRYTKISDPENPADSLILKEGMTAEFTMADICRDVVLCERKKQELAAAIKVQAAVMENILRDRPEIAALSDEILKIHFIFQKAKSFVLEGSNKVGEIDELISEYVSEIKQITEQTGIPPTPIVTDIKRNTEVKDLLAEKQPDPDPKAALDPQQSENLPTRLATPEETAAKDAAADKKEQEGASDATGK